jgi:hypothetical protein
MASMNQKGFTILAPLELGGFKRLTIDAKVPLEKWELCPAHGIKLTPFSALVGKGGTPIIRIGYCPVCFYTAYVDRPTAARIRNFYAGDWDSAKTGHRKVLNEATTDSADLPRDRFSMQDAGTENIYAVPRHWVGNTFLASNPHMIAPSARQRSREHRSLREVLRKRRL